MAINSGKMTLAQKIIARAASRDHVTAGEIVTCAVDLAMIHDSGGPRRVAPILAQLNSPVWDTEKIVVVSDHYVPAVDAQSAAILAQTRKWVTDNKISHFYDMQGICHVLLPERGHLSPGMFVVGGDSHSPMGGAHGCLMFGVGATDMAGVLVTGETWIKVPQTIRIECRGELPAAVSAKDMILALCAKLGMGGGKYQVVQFTGPTIDAMGMTERMTLCNMTAELGALSGMIASDAITTAAIEAAGGVAGDLDRWQGDEGAVYFEEHVLDVGALAPQVAVPHSPANAMDVSKCRETKIDQAYLGACTGAKLEDLQMAAGILKGRKVATSTRLLVAPASARIMAAAAADGTLAILTDAGALLMPTGCGACAGYGAGVLAENEVCIASTARNFKGRMGALTSQVYLGSPYTVAASAIAGQIADPRDFLPEGGL